MKFTPAILCLLVLSTFLLNSCYKHKEGGIRNPDVILTKRGFRAEAIIPERNAIWGILYDSLVGAKKVEYNLESGIFKTLNYCLPTASYYYADASSIYSCRHTSGVNDVDIINLMDSSVFNTIHFNYYVNSCAVADSKLYILEGTIGPSKLHVYDLFNYYAFDSTWVGTNAVNIAVSQDGSRIYTSTDLLSNTVYSTEYKKSDSTLSDIAVSVPSGPFSFTDGSYSMSDNGKKVLTSEGILYKDNMTVLHDYKLPSLPYTLADDGGSAIFIQQKFATLFDTYGYSEFRRKLLPNFGGDNYSYVAILPFYYLGTHYAAVTYWDSKYQSNTVITKL